MPGTVILIFMSYNLLMAGLCKLLEKVKAGKLDSMDWEWIASAGDKADYYDHRFIAWFIVYILYSVFTRAVAEW